MERGQLKRQRQKSDTKLHAGKRLAPHDEALQRWAAAESADTEHSYFGMRPLENDAVGEAVAVVTMLICFL